jgi:predicted AlkP superfamily phosphohydrolase/phosphomutase
MLSSWLGLSTYPEKLKEEVASLVGNYDIIVDYHNVKYDDVDLFLEDLRKAVDKKLRVSRWLLKSRGWDLFADVLSFTDWLQHRMWHFIDPRHPMYPGDKVAQRYYARFAEFWSLIDEYVADVASVADLVLIVSDHGFGPNLCTFYLNTWLQKRGYLVERRRSTSKRLLRFLLRAVVGALRATGVSRVLPVNLKRTRLAEGLRRAANPRLVDEVDLDSSCAYDPGYTIVFGGIHLNRLKGFCGEAAQRLVEDLGSLGLSEGFRIDVWRAKELYSGEAADSLPDLIVLVDEGACVVVKDLYRRRVYVKQPYSPRHTGSHKLEGIFIGWGADVKGGAKGREPKCV